MTIKSKLLLIIVVSVASLALLAMLIYNLVHTGGLLASYVEPAWVGYIAAFGIELAVVGLSITIGTRKWHSVNTGFFYWVLGAVVVVSFLANVAEGHLQRYSMAITWETITEIDWLQGIIGLAATGLISIITMAMSEIIGQYIVQLAFAETSISDGNETEETPDLHPVALEGEVLLPADGNEEVPIASNGHSKKELVRILRDTYPDWTYQRLAEEAGCSTSTVSKALRE
jgi:hypothetical protein